MIVIHRFSSYAGDHDAPGRHRSPGICCAALYAGILALSAAALPAQADMAARPASFADEPARLSDEELRGLRGGMIINGVDFDFGATVRVFVDGPLVAETALTMNPDGSIARNTTIHDANMATTFSDPSQLNGSKLHFGNLNGAEGFVINGPNGVSIALNNIKPGDILGLLANDAIGRNITQTIEVNLTINNFTQINSNLQSSMAMGRAISAAVPNPMLSH